MPTTFLVFQSSWMFFLFLVELNYCSSKDGRQPVPWRTFVFSISIYPSFSATLHAGPHRPDLFTELPAVLVDFVLTNDLSSSLPGAEMTVTWHKDPAGQRQAGHPGRSQGGLGSSRCLRQGEKASECAF